MRTRLKRNKTRFDLKAMALVALISLAAGVAVTMRLDMAGQSSAGNFWKEAPPAAEAPAATRPESFVDLAKKLSPSVVNISTTQIMKQRPLVPFPEFKGPFEEFFGDEFKRFFDEPQREFKRQSLGSGFVLNKEGFILTNQHVIDNATEIIVTLSEGKKEYMAEVVGQDQKLDIALIKIKPDEELPVVALGDSDSIQIGEWVMAIGNPFGLGGSVTAGIVSQKGRIIGAGPYDNFIQTDASINPGNSGGPLFNMRGEVVGINTAIVAGGQGLGFATPINMAKEVLGQLRESGRVTRGWIGVSIQELTPELARTFGLKDSRGVLVSSVTAGDPAEAAGLKAGDVIVSFDGKPMTELNELPRTVASTPPGKSVEVKVLRGGREKTFFIKVAAKRDDDSGEGPAVGDEEPAPDKRIGLSVQPLTSETARRLGLPDADGVYVASVAPDSPAGRAGLRRGDVVRDFDGMAIKTVKDYSAAVNAADKEKKEVVRLLVVRAGTPLYMALKLR